MRPLRTYSRAVLFSASYLALAVAGSSQLWAQDAEPPSTAPAGERSNTNTSEPGATKEGDSQLPPLRVDEPNRKPRTSTTQPSKQVTTTAPARQAPRRDTPRTAAKPARSSKPQTATANATAASGPWAAQSQSARTGTVGVYSNSTSVATKVNTPLVNIPQSVSVLTKDFIKDQALLGVTDLTRYVPGVAVHQGEGNRDELIIRGVDSSANFFVNGFRDDVQYFRDLYNAQSVEILRGPSALTFGRGVGGGLLNRTLKEADGTRVYDTTFQTGSFGDRRFTLGCRPGRQRQRRRTLEPHGRREPLVPRLQRTRAVRHQSDDHVSSRRQYQGQVQLRILPRSSARPIAVTRRRRSAPHRQRRRAVAPPIRSRRTAI